MSDTDGSIDSQRGYTLTRRLDAPRLLVWRALAEPELFARWFGAGTDGVEVHQWDFEPGGRWRASMRWQGSSMPWAGRFEEIDEPDRLVWAFVDAADLGEVYEVMTITLADEGTGTELVLRQSGGHLTDEQYEQAKAGTASFLEALEVVVGGLE